MPNCTSRALPVRHHYRSITDSLRSQTRCTSSFNSFSEGRIRSLHSTNHTLRHISYSNAIGSRFSQSLTGWNSNSAVLLWTEEFQWTRNMSQWIVWTRTICSPKRFIQKEWFVHERNITRCVRERERERQSHITVESAILIAACVQTHTSFITVSVTRLCSPLGLELMVKLTTLLTVFTFILKDKAHNYGKGRYISDSCLWCSANHNALGQLANQSRLRLSEGGAL